MFRMQFKILRKTHLLAPDIFQRYRNLPSCSQKKQLSASHLKVPMSRKLSKLLNISNKQNHKWSTLKYHNNPDLKHYANVNYSKSFRYKFIKNCKSKKSAALLKKLTKVISSKKCIIKRCGIRSGKLLKDSSCNNIVATNSLLIKVELPKDENNIAKCVSNPPYLTTIRSYNTLSAKYAKLQHILSKISRNNYKMRHYSKNDDKLFRSTKGRIKKSNKMSCLNSDGDNRFNTRKENNLRKLTKHHSVNIAKMKKNNMSSNPDKRNRKRIINIIIEFCGTDNENSKYFAKPTKRCIQIYNDIEHEKKIEDKLENFTKEKEYFFNYKKQENTTLLASKQRMDDMYSLLDPTEITTRENKYVENTNKKKDAKELAVTSKKYGDILLSQHKTKNDYLYIHQNVNPKETLFSADMKSKKNINSTLDSNVKLKKLDMNFKKLAKCVTESGKHNIKELDTKPEFKSDISEISLDTYGKNRFDSVFSKLHEAHNRMHGTKNLKTDLEPIKKMLNMCMDPMNKTHSKNLDVKGDSKKEKVSISIMKDKIIALDSTKKPQEKMCAIDQKIKKNKPNKNESNIKNNSEIHWKSFKAESDKTDTKLSPKLNAIKNPEIKTKFKHDTKNINSLALFNNIDKQCITENDLQNENEKPVNKNNYEFTSHDTENNISSIVDTPTCENTPFSYSEPIKENKNALKSLQNNFIDILNYEKNRNQLDPSTGQEQKMENSNSTSSYGYSYTCTEMETECKKIDHKNALILESLKTENPLNTNKIENEVPLIKCKLDSLLPCDSIKDTENKLQKNNNIPVPVIEAIVQTIEDKIISDSETKTENPITNHRVVIDLNCNASLCSKTESNNTNFELKPNETQNVSEVNAQKNCLLSNTNQSTNNWGNFESKVNEAQNINISEVQKNDLLSNTNETENQNEVQPINKNKNNWIESKLNEIQSINVSEVAQKNDLLSNTNETENQNWVQPKNQTNWSNFESKPNETQNVSEVSTQKNITINDLLSSANAPKTVENSVMSNNLNLTITNSTKNESSTSNPNINQLKTPENSGEHEKDGLSDFIAKTESVVTNTLPAYSEIDNINKSECMNPSNNQNTKSNEFGYQEMNQQNASKPDENQIKKTDITIDSTKLNLDYNQTKTEFETPSNKYNNSEMQELQNMNSKTKTEKESISTKAENVMPQDNQIKNIAPEIITNTESVSSDVKNIDKKDSDSVPIIPLNLNQDSSNLTEKNNKEYSIKKEFESLYNNKPSELKNEMIKQFLDKLQKTKIKPEIRVYKVKPYVKQQFCYEELLKYSSVQYSTICQEKDIKESDSLKCNNLDADKSPQIKTNQAPLILKKEISSEYKQMTQKSQEEAENSKVPLPAKIEVEVKSKLPVRSIEKEAENELNTNTKTKLYETKSEAKTDAQMISKTYKQALLSALIKLNNLLSKEIITGEIDNINSNNAKELHSELEKLRGFLMKEPGKQQQNNATSVSENRIQYDTIKTNFLNALVKYNNIKTDQVNKQENSVVNNESGNGMTSLKTQADKVVNVPERKGKTKKHSKSLKFIVTKKFDKIKGNNKNNRHKFRSNIDLDVKKSDSAKYKHKLFYKCKAKCFSFNNPDMIKSNYTMKGFQSSQNINGTDKHNKSRLHTTPAIYSSSSPEGPNNDTKEMMKRIFEKPIVTQIFKIKTNPSEKDKKTTPPLVTPELSGVPKNQKWYEDYKKGITYPLINKTPELNKVLVNQNKDVELSKDVLGIKTETDSEKDKNITSPLPELNKVPENQNIDMEYDKDYEKKILINKTTELNKVLVNQNKDIELSKDVLGIKTETDSEKDKNITSSLVTPELNKVPENQNIDMEYDKDYEKKILINNKTPKLNKVLENQNLDMELNKDVLGIKTETNHSEKDKNISSALVTPELKVPENQNIDMEYDEDYEKKITYSGPNKVLENQNKDMELSKDILGTKTETDSEKDKNITPPLVNETINKVPKNQSMDKWYEDYKKGMSYPINKTSQLNKVSENQNKNMELNENYKSSKTENTFPKKDNYNSPLNTEENSQLKMNKSPLLSHEKQDVWRTNDKPENIFLRKDNYFSSLNTKETNQFKMKKSSLLPHKKQTDVSINKVNLNTPNKYTPQTKTKIDIIVKKVLLPLTKTEDIKSVRNNTFAEVSSKISNAQSKLNYQTENKDIINVAISLDKNNKEDKIDKSSSEIQKNVYDIISSDKYRKEAITTKEVKIDKSCSDTNNFNIPSDKNKKDTILTKKDSKDESSLDKKKIGYDTFYNVINDPSPQNYVFSNESYETTANQNINKNDAVKSEKNNTKTDFSENNSDYQVNHFHVSDVKNSYPFLNQPYNKIPNKNQMKTDTTKPENFPKSNVKTEYKVSEFDENNTKDPGEVKITDDLDSINLKYFTEDETNNEIENNEIDTAFNYINCEVPPGDKFKEEETKKSESDDNRLDININDQIYNIVGDKPFGDKQIVINMKDNLTNENNTSSTKPTLSSNSENKTSKQTSGTNNNNKEKVKTNDNKEPKINNTVELPERYNNLLPKDLPKPTHNKNKPPKPEKDKILTDNKSVLNVDKNLRMQNKENENKTSNTSQIKKLTVNDIFKVDNIPKTLESQQNSKETTILDKLDKKAKKVQSDSLMQNSTDSSKNKSQTKQTTTKDLLSSQIKIDDNRSKKPVEYNKSTSTPEIKIKTTEAVKSDQNISKKISPEINKYPFVNVPYYDNNVPTTKTPENPYAIKNMNSDPTYPAYQNNINQSSNKSDQDVMKTSPGTNVKTELHNYSELMEQNYSYPSEYEQTVENQNTLETKPKQEEYNQTDKFKQVPQTENPDTYNQLKNENMVKENIFKYFDSSYSEYYNKLDEYDRPDYNYYYPNDDTANSDYNTLEVKDKSAEIRNIPDQTVSKENTMQNVVNQAFQNNKYYDKAEWQNKHTFLDFKHTNDKQLDRFDRATYTIEKANEDYPDTEPPRVDAKKAETTSTLTEPPDTSNEPFRPDHTSNEPFKPDHSSRMQFTGMPDHTSRAPTDPNTSNPFKFEPYQLFNNFSKDNMKQNTSIAPYKTDQNQFKFEPDESDFSKYNMKENTSIAPFKTDQNQFKFELDEPDSNKDDLKQNVYTSNKKNYEAKSKPEENLDEFDRPSYNINTDLYREKPNILRVETYQLRKDNAGNYVFEIKYQYVNPADDTFISVHGNEQQKQEHNIDEMQDVSLTELNKKMEEKSAAFMRALNNEYDTSDSLKLTEENDFYNIEDAFTSGINEKRRVQKPKRNKVNSEYENQANVDHLFKSPPISTSGESEIKTDHLKEDLHVDAVNKVRTDVAKSIINSHKKRTNPNERDTNKPTSKTSPDNSSTDKKLMSGNSENKIRFNNSNIFTSNNYNQNLAMIDHDDNIKRNKFNPIIAASLVKSKFKLGNENVIESWIKDQNIRELENQILASDKQFGYYTNTLNFENTFPAIIPPREFEPSSKSVKDDTFENFAAMELSSHLEDIDQIVKENIELRNEINNMKSEPEPIIKSVTCLQKLPLEMNHTVFRSANYSQLESNNIGKQYSEFETSRHNGPSPFMNKYVFHSNRQNIENENIMNYDTNFQSDNNILLANQEVTNEENWNMSDENELQSEHTQFNTTFVSENYNFVNTIPTLSIQDTNTLNQNSEFNKTFISENYKFMNAMPSLSIQETNTLNQNSKTDEAKPLDNWNVIVDEKLIKPEILINQFQPRTENENQTNTDTDSEKIPEKYIKTQLQNYESYRAFKQNNHLMKSLMCKQLTAEEVNSQSIEEIMKADAVAPQTFEHIREIFPPEMQKTQATNSDLNQSLNDPQCQYGEILQLFHRRPTKTVIRRRRTRFETADTRSNSREYPYLLTGHNLSNNKVSNNSKCFFSSISKKEKNPINPPIIKLQNDIIKSSIIKANSMNELVNKNKPKLLDRIISTYSEICSENKDDSKPKYQIKNFEDYSNLLGKVIISTMPKNKTNTGHHKPNAPEVKENLPETSVTTQGSSVKVHDAKVHTNQYLQENEYVSTLDNIYSNTETNYMKLDPNNKYVANSLIQLTNNEENDLLKEEALKHEPSEVLPNLSKNIASKKETRFLNSTLPLLEENISYYSVNNAIIPNNTNIEENLELFKDKTMDDVLSPKNIEQIVPYPSAKMLEQIITCPVKTKREEFALFKSNAENIVLSPKSEDLEKSIRCITDKTNEEKIESFVDEIKKISTGNEHLEENITSPKETDTTFKNETINITLSPKSKEAKTEPTNETKKILFSTRSEQSEKIITCPIKINRKKDTTLNIVLSPNTEVLEKSFRGITAKTNEDKNKLFKIKTKKDLFSIGSEQLAENITSPVKTNKEKDISFKSKTININLSPKREDLEENIRCISAKTNESADETKKKLFSTGSEQLEKIITCPIKINKEKGTSLNIVLSPNSEVLKKSFGCIAAKTNEAKNKSFKVKIKKDLFSIGREQLEENITSPIKTIKEEENSFKNKTINITTPKSNDLEENMRTNESFTDETRKNLFSICSEQLEENITSPVKINKENDFSFKSKTINITSPKREDLEENIRCISAKTNEAKSESFKDKTVNEELEENITCPVKTKKEKDISFKSKTTNFTLSPIKDFLEENITAKTNEGKSESLKDTFDNPLPPSESFKVKAVNEQLEEDIICSVKAKKEKDTSFTRDFLEEKIGCITTQTNEDKSESLKDTFDNPLPPSRENLDQIIKSSSAKANQKESASFENETINYESEDITSSPYKSSEEKSESFKDENPLSSSREDLKPIIECSSAKTNKEKAMYNAFSENLEKDILCSSANTNEDKYESNKGETNNNLLSSDEGKYLKENTPCLSTKINKEESASTKENMNNAFSSSENSEEIIVCSSTKTNEKKDQSFVGESLSPSINHLQENVTSSSAKTNEEKSESFKNKTINDTSSETLVGNEEKNESFKDETKNNKLSPGIKHLKENLACLSIKTIKEKCALFKDKIMNNMPSKSDNLEEVISCSSAKNNEEKDQSVVGEIKNDLLPPSSDNLQEPSAKINEEKTFKGEHLKEGSTCFSTKANEEQNITCSAKTNEIKRASFEGETSILPKSEHLEKIIICPYDKSDYKSESFKADMYNILSPNRKHLKAKIISTKLNDKKHKLSKQEKLDMSSKRSVKKIDSFKIKSPQDDVVVTSLITEELPENLPSASNQYLHHKTIKLSDSFKIESPQDDCEIELPEKLPLKQYLHHKQSIVNFLKCIKNYTGLHNINNILNQSSKYGASIICSSKKGTRINKPIETIETLCMSQDTQQNTSQNTSQNTNIKLPKVAPNSKQETESAPTVKILIPSERISSIVVNCSTNLVTEKKTKTTTKNNSNLITAKNNPTTSNKNNEAETVFLPLVKSQESDGLGPENIASTKEFKNACLKKDFLLKTAQKRNSPGKQDIFELSEKRPESERNYLNTNMNIKLIPQEKDTQNIINQKNTKDLISKPDANKFFKIETGAVKKELETLNVQNDVPKDSLGDSIQINYLAVTVNSLDKDKKQKDPTNRKTTSLSDKQGTTKKITSIPQDLTKLFNKALQAIELVNDNKNNKSVESTVPKVKLLTEGKNKVPEIKTDPTTSVKFQPVIIRKKKPEKLKRLSKTKPNTTISFCPGGASKTLEASKKDSDSPKPKEDKQEKQINLKYQNPKAMEKFEKAVIETVIRNTTSKNNKPETKLIKPDSKPVPVKKTDAALNELLNTSKKVKSIVRVKPDRKTEQPKEKNVSGIKKPKILTRAASLPNEKFLFTSIDPKCITSKEYQNYLKFETAQKVNTQNMLKLKSDFEILEKLSKTNNRYNKKLNASKTRKPRSTHKSIFFKEVATYNDKYTLMGKKSRCKSSSNNEVFRSRKSKQDLSLINKKSKAKPSKSKFSASKCDTPEIICGSVKKIRPTSNNTKLGGNVMRAISRNDSVRLQKILEIERPIDHKNSFDEDKVPKTFEKSNCYPNNQNFLFPSGDLTFTTILNDDPPNESENYEPIEEINVPEVIQYGNSESAVLDDLDNLPDEDREYLEFRRSSRRYNWFINLAPSECVKENERTCVYIKQFEDEDKKNN